MPTAGLTRAALSAGRSTIPMMASIRRIRVAVVGGVDLRGAPEHALARADAVAAALFSTDVCARAVPDAAAYESTETATDADADCRALPRAGVPAVAVSIW